MPGWLNESPPLDHCTSTASIIPLRQIKCIPIRTSGPIDRLMSHDPQISLAFPGRTCVTVCNTMDSSTKTSHDPAELGELERSILLIIWRSRSVTAEQVREQLDRPLKDSTVRTVLRRLEEKGYLAHRLDDRAFIYRPSQSRQRVAGRAAKRIVDWFCDGSVEALLVGMVDSKVLDRAELKHLAERIAIVQKSTPSAKEDS